MREDRPAGQLALATSGVVHIYKDYPPAWGGIEGHVDLLTRLLAERGLPTQVLCSRRRQLQSESTTKKTSHENS